MLRSKLKAEDGRELQPVPADQAQVLDEEPVGQGLAPQAEAQQMRGHSKLHPPPREQLRVRQLVPDDFTALGAEVHRKHPHTVQPLLSPAEGVCRPPHPQAHRGGDQQHHAQCQGEANPHHSLALREEGVGDLTGAVRREEGSLALVHRAQVDPPHRHGDQGLVRRGAEGPQQEAAEV